VSPPDAELRKDARRNRERIIAAGRELFRDSSDVPMYEVARRAGVGQATLYRHFPDRSVLVEAISEIEFAGLAELASAHRGQPQGLFVLLQGVAHRLAGLRGLTELIRSDPVDFAHERRREETGALFAEPLATARAAGAVRADLEMDDVFRILMMVQGAVADEPDRDARQRAAERALELLFGGVAR
jgi:AcrR family transcriptional regulator